ncbi:stalk domain-containing protein [Marinicrinis lubricantis]|uniref:Stalk domain-containing protein n=1 Tax=Marinicrinis lubricantis TaxID=2086470 RepID=A0ABW1IJP9_9BACL
MKRMTLAALSVTLLPLAGWGGTVVNAQEAALKVILDGKTLQFDVPPVAIQGTTLVPMRKIFEGLGATITSWDNATQTVTAVKHQTEIMYTIGETEALKNGREVTFSATPGRIVQGQTFVPLRFISESLGANVQYDAQTKTITILSGQSTKNWAATPELVSQYRLTLPHAAMMEKVPAWVSYLKQHQDANSIVFFGDSTTWGSYMGRLETASSIIQQTTGIQTFNFGVPGFTTTHMVPFMKYVMQDVNEPQVAIQLQYFWGDSKEYTGLKELLTASIPDYSTGLAALGMDMNQDDEYLKPSFADYTARDPEALARRIDELKPLFIPKSAMDPELEARLIELKNWIAARPDQLFYIYVPPYMLTEIEKNTCLSAPQLANYTKQMEALFKDMDNVRFRDFNQMDIEWKTTDFIDWIHRSAQGEKRFAELLQNWLTEG